jgi:hypothetical protein
LCGTVPYKSSQLQLPDQLAEREHGLALDLNQRMRLRRVSRRDQQAEFAQFLTRLRATIPTTAGAFEHALLRRLQIVSSDGPHPELPHLWAQVLRRRVGIVIRYGTAPYGIHSGTVPQWFGRRWIEADVMERHGVPSCRSMLWK